MTKFLGHVYCYIDGAILGIYKLGVERYNKDYGRDVKIDNFLQIIGLADEEIELFTRTIVGEFAEQIGPVIWRIDTAQKYYNEG